MRLLVSINNVNKLLSDKLSLLFRVEIVLNGSVTKSCPIGSHGELAHLKTGFKLFVEFLEHET